MRLRLRGTILILSALAGVSCSGKAGQAAAYRVDTPMSTIVSALGPAPYDEHYSPDNGLHTSSCPRETVRVVRYDGPGVFQLHPARAFLCLDKTERLIKVSYLNRCLGC
jgi:hypothetical protein